MGQRRVAAHAELGDRLFRAADEFERADRAPVELAATGVFNSTVMSDLHFPLDLSELRPVADLSPYPYPFAPFSSEPPDGPIDFLAEPFRHLLPNIKIFGGKDSMTVVVNTMFFDRELEIGVKDHATALTGSPVTVSPSAVKLAGTETFWIERDFLQDVWTAAFVSGCIEGSREDITVRARSQTLYSMNVTHQPGVVRSALSMEVPFMIVSENSSSAFTMTPYVRYSQNGYLRRVGALAADVGIVFVLVKLGAVGVGAGAVEAVRQLAPVMQ